MRTGYLYAKTEGVYLPESLKLPFPAERMRIGTLLFQCEVMFGSPSSNCGGNGICKILAGNRHSLSVFKRTSCNHAKAYITTSGDAGNAYLIFRREWLCSNLVRRYFRHSILEMPEPCPIPSGIVAALGLKTTELPAGLHLMEDCGTHIRINFHHTD